MTTFRLAHDLRAGVNVNQAMLTAPNISPTLISYVLHITVSPIGTVPCPIVLVQE